MDSGDNAVISVGHHCHKRTAVARRVGGRGCGRVRLRDGWEVSVPCAEFYYDPKTALQNKTL